MIERDLTQLSTALPDYAPRLLPIGGELRLVLTIAASHTLDVRHIRGDFWLIQSVYLDPDGNTHEHMIGCVYGLALIPPLVREYKAIHAAQQRAS